MKFIFLILTLIIYRRWLCPFLKATEKMHARKFLVFYAQQLCGTRVICLYTVFHRGGNAFSKTLRNYAVRVDMLRDLRLAGSTAKRSLLYAATLRNTPLSRTPRPHIRISRAHAYRYVMQRKCRK